MAEALEADDVKGLLLAAFESAIGSVKCAYAAGPLSTSRDFYEALAAGREIDVEELRRSNRSRLTAFAERLRATLSAPVIDPGLIKVVSWDAREHGEFYLEVIERFCGEMWFIDGWEFSRGATKELVFGMAHRIRCVTADGSTITWEQAGDHLAAAESYLESLGVSTDILQRRIGELEDARRAHARGVGPQRGTAT